MIGGLSVNNEWTQDEIYAFINESLDKLEKWRGEQLNLDAGHGIIGERAGALHRGWMYSFSPGRFITMTLRSYA